MRPLGLGIVGCGGAAADVVAALTSSHEWRVVATYDRKASLARDLALRSGAYRCASLDELLAHPGVDAVYIALPHDLLAGTAERALLAGRHALVEKPMALDVADITRLDGLARHHRLRLGVFFELRFAGAVVAGRRVLRAGAIGRVSEVRVITLIDKPRSYWRHGLSGRSTDPWRASRARAGGGILLMNTIHQLDLVRHLTGSAFSRLHAEVATRSSRVDVEDAATATFRLSDGAIGSIAAAAHSPGAQDGERIEIDGTLGRLDLPDLYGTGRPRLYLRRPWREMPAGEWLELPIERPDPYLDAVEAFGRAIRRRTAPPTGAADAAAALSAVLALYRSAASGALEEALGTSYSRRVPST